VAPQGCTAASDPNACESLRGGSPTLFNINQSSTWESIGIYGFPIEKNHGYSGDAQYGYESITLGLPGENGLMLNNMTVGAFAVLEPWLGMFGINPRNTNFSSFNDGSPSFITILRKNNLIPSLSFGYTAGAPYREPPALVRCFYGAQLLSQVFEQFWEASRLVDMINLASSQMISPLSLLLTTTVSC